MREEPLNREQFVSVIRKSGELLGQVRNVGETGDWDDLYTVMDFMATAFAHAYPTSPCRAGCSDCCQEALFRVSELEWQPVAAYLAVVLAPEQARELARQALVAFGPYREGYEALARFWQATPWGAPGAPTEELPSRCPMLGPDDRCTVYEVRPLTCRAYGHLGVTLAGAMSMLICRRQGVPFIEGLKDHWEGQFVMAPCEPYFAKLMSLKPGMAIAPLPLWMLWWAEEILDQPSQT